MKIESFLKIIDTDFYTGVPDSLLKPLCDYLMNPLEVLNGPVVSPASLLPS